MTNELTAVTTAQAWGFFQVFLRLIALFAVAPVFGSREVPVPVRIGLALVLSLAVYPLVSQSVAPVPTDMFLLLAAALRETVIGLLMGAIVSLLFSAAVMAGDLMDIQMGFGMAAIFNPALGAQTAMMGQFMQRYSVVVFLLVNGHHLLLNGVVTSFTALPAASFTLSADALRLAGDLATTILVAGLRIAAPAVATLLIVDVALALVSRAAPQINVFVLGMQVKVVIGLIVFMAALGLITTVLQTYLTGATGEALGALRAFRGQ